MHGEAKTKSQLIISAMPISITWLFPANIGDVRIVAMFRTNFRLCSKKKNTRLCREIIASTTETLKCCIEVSIE